VTCAWTLRDGSRCRQVAQVEGFCPAHFTMQRALEAEDKERVDRGEPPLNGDERNRFLKEISRARKAAKKNLHPTVA
jgi:hypothetical protein